MKTYKTGIGNSVVLTIWKIKNESVDKSAQNHIGCFKIYTTILKCRIGTFLNLK